MICPHDYFVQQFIFSERLIHKWNFRLKDECLFVWKGEIWGGAKGSIFLTFCPWKERIQPISSLGRRHHSAAGTMESLVLFVSQNLTVRQDQQKWLKKKKTPLKTMSEQTRRRAQQWRHLVYSPWSIAFFMMCSRYLLNLYLTRSKTPRIKISLTH